MTFNELRYQDPRTKTYLGSPSIVMLENGDLLATHDYFGPCCPRNHENEEHLTSLYRSSDGGESWTNVTHIANAFWSNLFVHRGDVYLLGTSQQYGSIVIRRSSDGGNTWSYPLDERSGLLFRGGVRRTPPNYHCAPVPVLIKGNRIYRAFEDCTPCRWGTGFQASVISADADADLLDASNWRISNKLPFDQEWTRIWDGVDVAGWLEGNIVEGPDGQLWNILRVNGKRADSNLWDLWDKAAMVRVSEDGSELSFDPDTGFIDFPGGHSKFSIRFDRISGKYLTISNGTPEGEKPVLRSVLSLYSSDDLVKWEHVCVLIRDDSDLSYEESLRLTGFQYVDWQFDGDDLIYLVRTAYDGAHNYHDANRITFHRLESFRTLL